MKSGKRKSDCWLVTELCSLHVLNYGKPMLYLRSFFNKCQEEEALARKAKEEEAAALEFEKWKGAFSVDAEGTTENELRDGAHGLLADFVEYIKVDAFYQ